MWHEADLPVISVGSANVDAVAVANDPKDLVAKKNSLKIGATFSFNKVGENVRRVQHVKSSPGEGRWPKAGGDAML